MSRLLDAAPFAERDDAALLSELNALTRWHWDGCESYRRVWPGWTRSDTFEDLPFLHVGTFKHHLFRTEAPGIKHQRTLTSSATTGSSPSRIVLDERSSALQSQSSVAILEDSVGPDKRPLLVLDDATSLRKAGQVSARVAAAMSLRPVASDILFLLDGAGEPPRVRWDLVREVLSRERDLLVYGFTSVMWLAWGAGDVPPDVRAALASCRVHFVHSGGWKKLEAMRVEREQFDGELLQGVAPGSRVVDFYGLVEQVGVIYPLCEHGARHVPRWAAVTVRDPWTLKPIEGEPGLLNLMNVLAYGAPYHNVLTEDLGRWLEGKCPCGRPGQQFELVGRLPKTEVRGCANV